MIWYNSLINSPPKNRLILITCGIAWKREDEEIPAYIYKDVVQRDAYFSHKRIEIGNCFLVYWKSIDSNDPYMKELNPGYWKMFGGGEAPKEFKYWSEYENPITESTNNAVHSTTVPQIENMPVSSPSEEEIKNRKFMKMLGF